MKKNSRKITWPIVWKVFSQYIRERDKWQCVVCSRSKEAGHVQQAGHVVPVGNAGDTIRFLEDDVFCQCRACNQAHAKNQSLYYSWYDSKYGKEKREQMHMMKKQTGMLFVSMDKAFSKNDYAGVKEYYDFKLKELALK